MPWPTDDLEYDAPDTVPSNPAREGFSAGARKPWRQGIYNLVTKVKAILAQHGVAGGLATLDDNTKLPLDQLTVHTHPSSQSPHIHSQYMLASQRGAAGGIARLDGAGLLLRDEIPGLLLYSALLGRRRVTTSWTQVVPAGTFPVAANTLYVHLVVTAWVNSRYVTAIVYANSAQNLSRAYFGSAEMDFRRNADSSISAKVGNGEVSLYYITGMSMVRDL